MAILREDMKRLRRAVQALLDHHRINLPDPGPPDHGPEHRPTKLRRRAATPLDQAVPHEQAINLVANTISTPAQPTTPDLVRQPGHWRDEHGNHPDQTLSLTQTGPTLDGTEPGWVTVTGWRNLDHQHAPTWVRVQIRTHPAQAP